MQAAKNRCRLALAGVLVGTMLLGLGERAAAAEADLASSGHAQLVASPESGWAQWRGPRRDGICDETNLLQSWPDGGPKLLWKTEGLGKGYSSPIIHGNKLFITGDAGGGVLIFCLDLSGQKLWQTTNGAAWRGPYPGARACCAYRDGRLFHMNAHGRVACLEPESGRELWAVNLLERFGAKVNTWAFSECLLVDGDKVIVTPGGTKALMAALDAKTGQTVWTTPPLRLGPSNDPRYQTVSEPAGEADHASYASPLLFQQDGHRQIVNCSLRHVFGVQGATGRLLWTRPLRTRYQVVASTPVLVGDGVFATAPDTEDARLYRVTPEPRRAPGQTNAEYRVAIQEQWRTDLDTCHGGLVYLPALDALYGSWYRSRKGWACIDVRTGAVRYEMNSVAKGSILYADRRLYYLSEEGEMLLVEPARSGFNITGRFRLVPPGKSDVWPHPVILNGKLYLRYNDVLNCYNIRRLGQSQQ